MARVVAPSKKQPSGCVVFSTFRKTSQAQAWTYKGNTADQQLEGIVSPIMKEVELGVAGIRAEMI